jgi:hypothetical protein
VQIIGARALGDRRSAHSQPVLDNAQPSTTRAQPMATPTLTDVMRMLASDGKRGNMIVTLLSPDRTGDDGESLTALASTSKMLYQNEDVQEALDTVRMYRTIAPRFYTTMPSALAAGVFDTMLNDPKQFKTAIRYLSNCGARFTHARDLLVLYRDLLRARRWRGRARQCDRRRHLLARACVPARNSTRQRKLALLLQSRWLRSKVYAEGPLGGDMLIAHPSDGWVLSIAVTKAYWDAAAAPVALSNETHDTEAVMSGSGESDDGSD